jgi:NADPH:quinone reductase-like Zn-dependent oxidoreductase
LAAQTHHVFGFEKAADAHLMMQQAQHRGKLLLSPSL